MVICVPLVLVTSVGEGRLIGYNITVEKGKCLKLVFCGVAEHTCLSFQDEWDNGTQEEVPLPGGRAG